MQSKDVTGGAEKLLIPLTCLFVSPLNVRKQGADDDVTELADNIQAIGLIEELTVIAELDEGGKRRKPRPTGRYAVIAGGRRLRALQLLAERGDLPQDADVPCSRRAAEVATAVSIAENVHREQLHPADEFVAYQTKANAGKSVEAIAAAFGVLPAVVKRRLKLASVAPDLIAAYRRDEMSVEQLQAFAVTDDHEAQLRVWNERKTWNNDPEDIRAALREGEIEADSALGRFVGLDDYVAAGGDVRRDLFDDEDEGSLVDAPLVRLLATCKLDAAKAELEAEGWGAVEVRTAPSSMPSFGLHRAKPAVREATPEEAEQMAQWQAERDRLDVALQAFYDSDEGEPQDGFDPEAAERRTNELDEQIEAFDQRREYWSPEAKAAACAIVGIDRQGKLTIERGVMRQGDGTAQRPSSQGTHRSRGNASVAAGGDTRNEKPAGPAISRSLMARLTAERSLALQEALAEQPSTALAVLAHNLVQSVFEVRLGADRSALEIRASTTAHQIDRFLEVEGKESEATNPSRAAVAIEQRRQHWADRIPGDSKRLLPWLIALPAGDLHELIALCAALTLHVVVGDVADVRLSDSRSALGDELAAALRTDLADWWEATPEAYLRYVSKAMLIEAVTEAVSAEAAAPLAAMKKDAAVAKAAQLLQGTRWLPAPLRGAALPE